ncbi:unnamed protein product [Ectocarpus sp. CCAP 1310/34]|nr:unnamed protein product [Ectocarpus sp. CCAP 1310/34]
MGGTIYLTAYIWQTVPSTLRRRWTWLPRDFLVAC